MALKPQAPDKKLFAPNKPLADAVVKSKPTDADTKSLESAQKEIEAATKALETAAQKSNAAFGKAIKAAPDVAKTGKPSGVPIPYPIFSKLEKETKSAVQNTEKALKKVEKAQKRLSKILDKEIKTLSKFAKSKGDEAGAHKGLVEAKRLSESNFQSYSFDVKAEGKNMIRFLDLAKPPKK
ncbi:MAG: PAAR-like domain-containing protein [Sulfitobacter sp.]